MGLQENRPRVGVSGVLWGRLLLVCMEVVLVVMTESLLQTRCLDG